MATVTGHFHHQAPGIRLTDREAQRAEERPNLAGAERHAYWYESTSSRARLNRNLIKMLDHVRLGGQVAFTDDTFTLTKRPAPQSAQKPWDAW